MRPRSKLFSKRRLLLPTIREGTEETVRERNEANAAHGHAHSVSSEDYLLSICHLAHPTFPCRDVSPDNTRQLEATHHGRRGHGRRPAEEAQGERTEPGGGGEVLTCGNADPLEYLYGHRGNLSGGARRAFAEGRFLRPNGSQARSRANSVPRASSPVPPRQRKSSCPELHGAVGASDQDVASQAQRRGPGLTMAAVEAQKPAVKQSLISQWISDCRSAWREARVRVCMLPAIAEI